MKRREFITLLGGAAAWPISVRAQQALLPVVGFLSARSPQEAASVLRAFLDGLAEAGYVEGKNVIIEYRWAEGHYDRLPALADELVRRRVAVIAATGGEPSPFAAKAATTSIPIVFTAGGDSVEAGLVASLNRPGGNLTGTTIMGLEMGPKRLELIRELVPSAHNIAMLVNPKFPTGAAEARDVQSATRSLGIKFQLLHASTEREIGTAFEALVKQRADVLIIATDPFLLGQREQLVRLAARHAVPTMYFLREFVEAGGLMSYGPNIANGYRQAGVYAGRVLSGASPAVLPVLRPTHFLLILNVKTAKFRRHALESLRHLIGESMLQDDCLPIDVAKRSEPLDQRCEQRLFILRAGRMPQDANLRDSTSALRARSERPRRSRSGNDFDEIAPSHPFPQSCEPRQTGALAAE